jgi:hypothetical protein
VLYPSLAYLNLNENGIGLDGVQSLPGVLGQCPALAHLNLSENLVGPDGVESLPGVLGQCPALDHLDLRRRTSRQGLYVSRPNGMGKDPV